MNVAGLPLARLRLDLFVYGPLVSPQRREFLLATLLRDSVFYNTPPPRLLSLKKQDIDALGEMSVEKSEVRQRHTRSDTISIRDLCSRSQPVMLLPSSSSSLPPPLLLEPGRARDGCGIKFSPGFCLMECELSGHMSTREEIYEPLLLPSRVLDTLSFSFFLSPPGDVRKTPVATHHLAGEMND